MAQPAWRRYQGKMTEQFSGARADGEGHVPPTRHRSAPPTLLGYTGAGWPQRDPRRPLGGAGI